jgi:hypothetical protein
MKIVLAALLCVIALCNAAALPRLHKSYDHSRISTHGRPHTDEYTLDTQVERRSVESGSIKVALQLLDSGYCGNISIGSQDTSILTLFDLNGSQLAAIPPTVQYCANPDQCSSGSPQRNSYDPSLSDTAKDLVESFELSTTSATFTGTVYEDCVTIGGTFSLESMV